MILRKELTAFTLLELLVALSMIVLILTAIYGSYSAVTQSIASYKPRNILQQQAGLFLQRLTSELRCCYAGGSKDAPVNLPDNHPIAENIEQEKQPLFLGKVPSSGKIFLRFVTPTLVSKHKYSLGGLATVSYKMDESGRMMLRSEHRYITTTDDDDDALNWLPAFANVKTISVEYFEGEKWHEEWDSNEMNGLPQAVRISLVLVTEDTGPLSFVSTAQINCRGYQLPAIYVPRAVVNGSESPGTSNDQSYNEQATIKKK